MSAFATNRTSRWRRGAVQQSVPPDAPAAASSRQGRSTGTLRIGSILRAIVVFGLGVLILVIAVLYAIPQTSTLGAILLTGLLGGAVATHLRAGSPLFSHMLFGVYVGLMAWGGLFLRDERLRILVPIRR